MPKNNFRDGLLSLNTRQFGNVVELLIKFINKQKHSGSVHFDGLDLKKRIEIKASRVYKKNLLEFNESNLYKIIIQNNNKNRIMRQKDTLTETFDCNIQQIKTRYFDCLYYCLFYYDIIEMFRIDKNRVLSDKNVYYCNKQHKGNKNEGQFHINNKTYPYHKEKYFECSFTYKKIIELLNKGNG